MKKFILGIIFGIILGIAMSGLSILIMNSMYIAEHTIHYLPESSVKKLDTAFTIPIANPNPNANFG